MFTGPLKETTQAFVFVFCTNLIGGSIGCLWMQYLTTLPHLHMEGYSPSDFLVYPTRTDLRVCKRPSVLLHRMSSFLPFRSISVVVNGADSDVSLGVHRGSGHLLGLQRLPDLIKLRF